ncbi:hypothetical protein J7438_07790 [Thalassotalea sp. G20_0]|uniref:hypothetical protein n=1 Tax=Thalassotalea sp. G20_0 TaxID=2821093 RepID=UPI001ADD4C77|nr:hypothetical protein [Thalassotalea sp. G20_0]MBO9493988.1 hypothetical protein [Thalassotalea sp. G20_0]
MIPSEYNLFHSESSSSGAGINKSETHDALSESKRVPAQTTVSDSLSKRTVEPKFTNNYLGSSSFSSVLFDVRSQEYLLLVNAIRVMEKGPAFNDDKLGPVSRKKMTVSQLRKKKSELKSENDKKLRELERLTEKISSDVNNPGKKIRQKDVTCILEILSDFHNHYYFIQCMFFIIHKVVNDHGNDGDMLLVNAIRHKCGEVIELIYKFLLSRNDFTIVPNFQNLYLAWDTYYTFNIVGCCQNIDGSQHCASYFNPELPVKFALKIFRRFPDLTEQEREFLNLKKKISGNDELKIQALHFSLLTGKDVNLEMLISCVKNGCQRFQHTELIDKNNIMEYFGLLQVLLSATFCALERSDQDARRLLSCFDCFSFTISARVLKQYMLAKCEEKSGAVDTASRIYQSLVSGENQVPVFEELIACLEKLGDNDAVVQACMSAADYYRDKGIKRREEYYEHKAASYMLFMANKDDIDDIKGVDYSTGQGGIDVSSVQPDVEPQAKAVGSKKYKSNRKNKAKRGAENHTTSLHSSRPAEKTESVQSCATARPCSAGKVEKDTAQVMLSEVMATDSPEPGSGKNGRDYWRELNEMFLDYYHLPHKYRDAVESLSREACQVFPKDIWILHSAGWGFHLIGDEQKAAELLLKGLRQYLDRHYPEVKSFIPVNIYGNVETGLDRLKAHPEITPGSPAGLNVAAYLSSLAYVYRNLNKHCDEQMRSLANWLNPSRDARKKEKQRVSFAAKVNVIPAEVDLVTRRFMAFGHDYQE